jgi:Glycosyltransferase family 17
MPAKPKLYDCFTFNDEFDLLELRLEMSDPFVDRFVIVEAPTTFSGNEKPLHFARNAGRFERWRDKIVHVVVDDMPPPGGWRWAAEIHQRNALVRGLEGAADADVVLVSDADEIVHPEVLGTLKRGCECLTGFEMPRTFRFANWELPPNRYSRAARAMPLRQVEDPHHQRNHVEPERVISDGGRHFTTLGEINRVAAKFETYSHAEMDNPREKSRGYLSRAQEMGLDPFSRELVTVAGPSQLCSTQRRLLEMRPDLFDFGELPNRNHRELFRWYAIWRARRPTSDPLVERLDHEYERRLPQVMAIAGREIARHGIWTRPRSGARSAKLRVLDRVGR